MRKPLEAPLIINARRQFTALLMRQNLVDLNPSQTKINKSLPGQNLKHLPKLGQNSPTSANCFAYFNQRPSISLMPKQWQIKNNDRNMKRHNKHVTDNTNDFGIESMEEATYLYLSASRKATNASLLLFLTIFLHKTKRNTSRLS